MNIGITGWEGFIGSYLRERLGNPVLFEGDLRDLCKVKEFVKNCQRIYHLAGLNREEEGKILENNIHATGNLVLAVKNQNSPEIVFPSSRQVEWNPDSEYGLTKSIEEEIVKKADKWCIFRIPNVYGPGGKPFYNSVVATFTYQVAGGQEVTIHNRSDTREFIYIDDLVNELLNPRFSEYIYPRGEVMSIGQIHEYLTSRLGEHENLKRCLDYYLTRWDDVPS
ncbi:NAD-dependent epimerase/dehydratase family protein [Chloroflexota bacterium]